MMARMIESAIIIAVGVGLVELAMYIVLFLEGCNRRSWPAPLLVGLILIAAGISNGL